MEKIGTTNIILSNYITQEQKKDILQIFDDVYGKIKYLKKIDNINWKGDMSCLTVFGTKIHDKLKENNYFDLIKKYIVKIDNEDYEEDLLNE